MEWKTIDSAPKIEKPDVFTGRSILATDGRDIDVTNWTVEYPCGEGVWMRNYEPTDYIDNINYWHPTHWMELPSLPPVDIT